MNAVDLLSSIQKTFVQNQKLGASESIVYTHANTSTVENTFAFIGSIKYNNSSDESLENKVEMANVFLEEEPKANDIVEYGSKKYTVDENGWTKQNNLYILTVSEKRHKGRTSR